MQHFTFRGSSAAHVFMEITPSRLSIGFVRSRGRRQDGGTVFVGCFFFSNGRAVSLRVSIVFKLATLLAVLGMTCGKLVAHFRSFQYNIPGPRFDFKNSLSVKLCKKSTLTASICLCPLYTV